MNSEDIGKLLGGYATNTLSEEEQKALYEAALQDGKLFEALANEHALRELLDDPQMRATLLRALQPSAPAHRWIAPVSIAASVLVIASVVFVFNRPHADPGTETPATAGQPAPKPGIQREAAPAQAPAKPQVLAKKQVPPAEGRAKIVQNAPAAAAGTVAAPTADNASAAVSAGILQYSVLRQDPVGTYKPVEPGSAFAPTDSVRLTVQSAEAGFVEVSQKEPPRVLFAGAVERHVPVFVPATGGIVVGDSKTLRITFTAQGAIAGAAGNLMNQPQAPAAMAKRKSIEEPASKKMAEQSSPPQPFTVDVQLKSSALPK